MDAASHLAAAHLRRIALIGFGSFTHPDGTLELDFEHRARILPTDSEEERKRKLIEYERRQAVKDEVWPG